MTTSRYEYSASVQAEIEHMVRRAIPAPVRLRKATLAEDFGGTDIHYMLNATCALQVRCRFNRPIWAADKDVTLRTTEPPMIAARTYAPLILFLWFREGYAKAGKLVDTYQMAGKLDLERPSTPNGDGSSFIVITIGELVESSSLLRQGDDHDWAAACLGGNQRTLRILNR